MKNPEEIIRNQITLKRVYYFKDEIQAIPDRVRTELSSYGIEMVLAEELVNIKVDEHELLLVGSSKSLEAFKERWQARNKVCKSENNRLATIGFGEATNGTDIYVEDVNSIDVQFLDRIEKRSSGLPWTIAITKRCILREMTIDDLDDLYEMYSSPGFTDYIEPLYERQKELEYTQKYIEFFYKFYGFGLWIVTDRQTGAFIGRCGFGYRTVRPIDSEGEILSEQDFFDIGYTIAAPYQRKGLATEVCKRLLIFAKENLEMKEISSFIYPGNEVSVHLIDKLGFKYTQSVMEGDRLMHRYTKEL